MFGNESSSLISVMGTKVPGNESSTYGTFIPANESSLVRKFQLPKQRLLACFRIFVNDDDLVIIRYHVGSLSSCKGN